jgi:hypothetical protein
MQVLGRIAAVQEQRFKLLTDGGQAYLFTLARGAPLDAQKLRALHQTQQHLVVEFSGQPNLAGGVAHNVREAPHF